MFEIVLSTVLLLWTSSSNTAPPDLCEPRPQVSLQLSPSYSLHTLCNISVVLEITGNHQYTIVDSGQGVERSTF